MTSLGTWPTARAWRMGAWRDGVSYGALGLPLAFVALPLYVILPAHYAQAFGVPLAALGLLLLAARLLDAVVDPWLGAWVDARLAQGHASAWRLGAWACALLALGFALLFWPPAAIQGSVNALLLWCGVMLVITYLAYSLTTVLHQAWGARLGGGAAQRAQVGAWREGAALLGVLLASALPLLAGFGLTSAVFAGALWLGMWALRRSPTLGSPAPQGEGSPSRSSALGVGGAPTSPWAEPGFRRLLLVYIVNGTASAVPATLVLFFIRDRLQLPSAMEAVMLIVYFLAAALAMPLWVRLIKRFGLARAWAGGMALAVAVFIWAAGLQAGDALAFGLVCALSGVALGADLTVPSALLTGVMQRCGASGSREGAFLGWWNFATKLNLALAAGVALPMLAWFGYEPGARSEPALAALDVAYAVLPCVLKLLALALLLRLWMTHHKE